MDGCINDGISVNDFLYDGRMGALYFDGQRYSVNATIHAILDFIIFNFLFLFNSAFSIVLASRFDPLRTVNSQSVIAASPNTKIKN
jgi:hypothetical protein